MKPGGILNPFEIDPTDIFSNDLSRDPIGKAFPLPTEPPDVKLDAIVPFPFPFPVKLEAPVKLPENADEPPGKAESGPHISSFSFSRGRALRLCPLSGDPGAIAIESGLVFRGAV